MNDESKLLNSLISVTKQIQIQRDALIQIQAKEFENIKLHNAGCPEELLNGIDRVIDTLYYEIEKLNEIVKMLWFQKSVEK